MTELENTNAYIIENIEPVILKVSFLDILSSKEAPYLLVVKSASSECIRLTIYPIKKKRIIKIIISEVDIIENFLEHFSKIIQDSQVLHTSGLVKKGKQLYYEFYLNINKSDDKYKDLIASIDKIRYIFKEIKIEEIGLKKAQSR